MKWIYLLGSMACFFVSFTKKGDEAFHWLILGFVLLTLSKVEYIGDNL